MAIDPNNLFSPGEVEYLFSHSITFEMQNLLTEALELKDKKLVYAAQEVMNLFVSLKDLVAHTMYIYPDTIKENDPPATVKSKLIKYSPDRVPSYLTSDDYLCWFENNGEREWLTQNAPLQDMLKSTLVKAVEEFKAALDNTTDIGLDASLLSHKAPDIIDQFLQTAQAERKWLRKTDSAFITHGDWKIGLN